MSPSSFRRRSKSFLASCAVALAAGMGVPSGAQAAPPGGALGAAAARELVVELVPGAKRDVVTALVRRLAWQVARVSQGTHGVGDLLLLRPIGLLGVPIRLLSRALALVPGVRVIEQNMLVAIGGRYGGEQSQLSAYADELDAASMTIQPAAQQASIESPDGSAGLRVPVAVVDGGFDLRQELLVGRCAPGYDALDGDGNPEDFGNRRDDDGDGRMDAGVGHGTAVAAIVASLARGSWIVPVRVLDDEGNGTSFALADGIRRAVSLGARLVNVSVGAATRSDVVENAIAFAQSRGALVVSSAGNRGDDGMSYPGASDRVLSISGVDPERRRDAIASFGLPVDLSATSVSVVAPFPGMRRGYGRWRGTSFAAALTSAAAVRVVATGRPTSSTGDLLRSAARPHGPLDPRCEGRMGSGTLDVDGLVP